MGQRCGACTHRQPGWTGPTPRLRAAGRLASTDHLVVATQNAAASPVVTFSSV